jgi:hypothetical protein
VQPTTTQKTFIEVAYRSFFTSADRLRKESQPPPSPPDPKMKEKLDKLIEERDESIKKVLSDAQYKKYKEAIKKLKPPPNAPPNGQKPPPPRQ